jgi:hypothetical protein
LAALLLITSTPGSNATIVSLEDLPKNFSNYLRKHGVKLPPFNKSRTNSKTAIKKAQNVKYTTTTKGKKATQDQRQ